MNIFLPYNNIDESVQSLDNRRLIKQILECYQIYNSTSDKGYANHPVVVHYKQYPLFVVRYGLAACAEYYYRFDKIHKYSEFFEKEFDRLIQNASESDWQIPLFYAEHSINSPLCIRTTDNVEQLFQAKLISKWLNSECVTWTRRKVPAFYSEFLRK